MRIVQTRERDFKPLRRLNFPIALSGIFDQLTASSGVRFGAQVGIDRVRW